MAKTVFTFLSAALMAFSFAACCSAAEADKALRGMKEEIKTYDLKNKKVMVPDEFDIHPAKESGVNIVDWDRSCFLSQYHML